MRLPPVRWQLAHPSDMAPASPTHRRPWARRATRAVGGGGETAETLVARPSQTTGQQVNPLSFLTKLLRQTRTLDERRWFLGTFSKESRIAMGARNSLQWQCSEKGQQLVLPQGRSPAQQELWDSLQLCENQAEWAVALEGEGTAPSCRGMANSCFQPASQHLHMWSIGLCSL